MKRLTRRKFLRRALHFGIGGISTATTAYRLRMPTHAGAAGPAPALVEAQGLNDTTVQLLWMAVQNADSYALYRNGALLASVAGTRYDDTTVAAATSYSYAVAAIVAGVESVRSAAVSATTQAPRDGAAPTQPGPITVSNVTSSAATLKWSRSSDTTNVVGYRILRGAAGAPIESLVQITTTDAIASYTATSLRANTGYQFAVLAVDPSGNLSSPRTVTLTTLPSSDTTVPSAPSSSSVSATAFSSSRIDLIWGTPSVSDLCGYEIFRNGQLIGEVALPLRRYFSDNNLAPSSSHTYQVRCFDTAGNRSTLTTGRTLSTTAAGVVKIVRGPAIQWTDATSTRISWWTNIPAPSRVNYGVGGLTTQVSDSVLRTHHVMLIGGLSPGTTYSYRVVSNSASSSTLTFTTAASPGTTWAFAAVGDFGGGSSAQTRIATNIATGGTQFTQTLGDNVYPDAQDPNFLTTYSDFDARLYKPYATVMRQQTIWYANGNKEYYGDGAFWQNVWMPNNERWYSYDWGDAHILVLDSEQPYTSGSPQYQFAQADLSAAQGKAWRIVVVHRPPYSSTSAGSSSEGVRDHLIPLFEQQQVQLVLSGNSHNYERSFPLINGVPQSSGGITYIVSGGGGNGLNDFTTTQPTWSAFRAAAYEHVRITVSPGTLQIDAISGDTNAVIDSATIVHGAAAIGTVNGTVRDASTAAPLAGASVSLGIRSTTTDATGAYSFAAIDAGTYNLTASATGYASQTQSVTVVAGGTTQQNFALTAQRIFVFSDGFESGDLTAWTTSKGLTVQTTTVQSGGYAAQANTTVGNTYARKTLAATYADAYARIYMNLLSFSSQVNLLRLRTAADTSIAYLFVNTSGKLGLRNDVAAISTTSTTTITGGWHALELHVIINGSSSTTEVWLDGTIVNGLSLTANLGTTPIGRFQIGETQSGRTYNVVFDNVAFDTQPIGI